MSDRSVLIDLEGSGVLAAAFALDMGFAVSDVLYERELRTWPGSNLEPAGLRIFALTPEGVELAQRYRHREPRLSLPDAFALALGQDQLRPAGG